MIDLLGRRTLVNERPVEGASALLDGDVLSIGQARFGVRIQRPSELPSRPIHDPRPETIEPGSPVVLSRLADAYQGSQELALGPRESAVIKHRFTVEHPAQAAVTGL